MDNICIDPNGTDKRRLVVKYQRSFSFTLFLNTISIYVHADLKVNSSFEHTLHMEVLNDSKPFSNFKTILSVRNGIFFPILCPKNYIGRMILKKIFQVHVLK